MAPLASRTVANPEDACADEKILIGNLLLLDSQGHDSLKGMELTKTMFRRPNAKAVEAIVHHLYGVMHGKPQAKKFFKGVWPLSEKSQAKEFYKRVQEWLKELKDNNVLDTASATSCVSALKMGHGSRVVSLLTDLSHAALRMELSHMCGEGMGACSLPAPQASIQQHFLATGLVSAARGKVGLQAHRFLQLVQTASALHDAQQDAAAQLKDTFYKLRRQHAQLAELQGAPAGAALEDPALGSGQVPAQPADAWSAAKLWAALEAHLEAFSGLQGLVDSVAVAEMHPYAIDGAKLSAVTQHLHSAVPHAAAPPGQLEPLDVLAMMEAWLEDAAGVTGLLRQIAGHTPTGVTGGATAAPSPLLPTGGTASHAPHLRAHLGVHQAVSETLQGLRVTLAAQLAVAGRVVQRLEQELGTHMAWDEQCLTVDAGSASMAMAAMDDAVRADRQGAEQAGPATRAAEVHLQGHFMHPVPPTPQLRQLLLAAPAHTVPAPRVHQGPHSTGAPHDSEVAALLLSTNAAPAEHAGHDHGMAGVGLVGLPHAQHVDAHNTRSGHCPPDDGHQAREYAQPDMVDTGSQQHLAHGGRGPAPGQGSSDMTRWDYEPRRLTFSATADPSVAPDGGSMPVTGDVLPTEAQGACWGPGATAEPPSPVPEPIGVSAAMLALRKRFAESLEPS